MQIRYIDRMMKNIAFIKMHGLGNDFVIVDARKEKHSFTEAMVQFICDRHKGVGCDQFVVIENSAKSDCSVRFYNADGSESGACGNATRCVAKLIMKESGKNSTVLESRAGLLECKAAGDDITVNMGKARMGWQEIPLAYEADTLHVGIGEGPLQNPVCVSMGNPHAVFFVNDVKKVDLANLGPKLEHHKIFPERANIGVVQVVSENEIILRVWERGSGETMACGSGACAAAVAANARGLTGNNTKVRLAGGDLQIELRGGNVYMTGAAEQVFTGELKI